MERSGARPGKAVKRLLLTVETAVRAGLEPGTLKPWHHHSWLNHLFPL